MRPHDRIQHIVETLVSYWTLAALVAVATAWVITWNVSVKAHEDLTAVHAAADNTETRERIRVLREICRTLPGDQASCNRHEDD